MAPSNTGDTVAPIITVGLLEVQGAFLEHRVCLQKAMETLQSGLELRMVEVRTAEDLVSDMDGLIIPGGESTTISLYLKRNKMEEPLRKWVQDSNHVTWGTCAGMILLSKQTENQKVGGQSTTSSAAVASRCVKKRLGIMDTDVSRNFFGRQVQSFESQVTMKDKDFVNVTGKDTFHGVFIRAPAVVQTLGEDVSVLATLERPEVGDSVIVGVRQDNVISTAFHPELSDDLAWHVYFLNMIQQNKLPDKKVQKCTS